MNLEPLDLSTLNNRTIVIVSSQDVSLFLQDILAQINVQQGIVTSNQPVYSAFAFATESVRLHLEFQPEAHRSDDPMFAVFDKCFVDNSWMHDRSIQRYFHANRSFQKTAIFVLPQIKGLFPGLRADIDVLCIGTLPQDEAKRIYDWFFQTTISFPIFVQLLDTYTKDGGFLVLRLDCPSEAANPVKYHPTG